MPALWSALCGAGVLAAPAPSLVEVLAGSPRRPVEVDLAGAHGDNAARVTDLLAQAHEVLDALHAAGLPAVPLKGVDALLHHRYADPAARTMTDVDVLVPREAANEASAVVSGLGYRTVADGPPPSAHQLPAMARLGRAGSLELHVELLHPRWASLRRGSDVLAAASTGRTTRTDAALHLVAHAQLHDEAHLLWRLPMRALHETALLLSGTEAGAVSWDQVADRFRAVERMGALDCHLSMVQQLFGVPAPLPTRRRERIRAAATLELAEHRSAARRVEGLAFLPRALSAERMAAVRGASSGGGLLAARTRHVAAAVARRSVGR